MVGGSSYDEGNGVALGPDGSVFLVGCTSSSDVPVSANAPDGFLNGTSDAFILKFDASRSTLLFATLLGGTGDDCAHDVAADGSGSVFVVGETSSSDFPTSAGGFDVTPEGGYDAFVARLDGSTGAVEWALFLGGADDDKGYSVALATATGPASSSDIAEAVFVGGRTLSPNFPVTSGTLQSTSRDTVEGVADAFIAKVDSTGSRLEYSTFLGGSGFDTVSSVAVGPRGSAFVAGWTDSFDFPATAGAYRETLHSASMDAFVAHISATGSALIYATYLGGTGSDYANAIAVDGQGRAFVGGLTYSPDLPASQGATGDHLRGNSDAFLVELDASGTALLYASYLGGDGTETIYDLALDSDGRAVVVGNTESGDFPTTSVSLDSTLGGNRDAFAAVIDTESRSLVYATYIGGGGSDLGTSIQIAPDGAIVLAGTGDSTDLPGATNSNPGGGEDSFVFTLTKPVAYRMAISSSPAGMPMVVDDVLFEMPKEFWWAPGSTHTVEPGPVTESGGIRHPFVGWSDGGPANRAITIAGDGSLEADFATEYSLTLHSAVASPTGAGWYRSGEVAAVTLPSAELTTAGQTWRFGGWAGGGVTSGPNLTVLMDRPVELTANWVAVGAPPPEGGLAPMAPWVALMVIGPGLAVQFSSRAKYGAAGLLLVPLFTRLRRSELRNQYNRGRIAQFVEDNPGSSFSHIRVRLGMSNGACAYHLRVLERNEVIRRVVQGTAVRFYGMAYRFEEEPFPPLAYFQRRILEILIERNDATFGEIAEALTQRSLRIRKSNLNYHLRVLTQHKEIVLTRREARNKIYFIDVGEREALARRLREEARLDNFLENAETAPEEGDGDCGQGAPSGDPRDIVVLIPPGAPEPRGAHFAPRDKGKPKAG